MKIKDETRFMKLTRYLRSKNVVIERIIAGKLVLRKI